MKQVEEFAYSRARAEAETIRKTCRAFGRKKGRIIANIKILATAKDSYIEKEPELYKLAAAELLRDIIPADPVEARHLGEAIAHMQFYLSVAPGKGERNV